MPGNLLRSPLTLRYAIASGLVMLMASIVTLVIAPSPTRAATHTVQIQDSAFSPALLTVAVGDTVTWTNADDRPHTVTADAGPFDSGNLDPGQSYSYTFTAPGSVAYVCTYHDGMSAVITVEAAAPAAPAAVAPAAAGADPSGVAGDGQREQPNTALPFTNSGGSLLAIPLIGLGLIAFAVAVSPARRATVAVPSIGRQRGGWRR